MLEFDLTLPAMATVLFRSGQIENWGSGYQKMAATAAAENPRITEQLILDKVGVIKHCVELSIAKLIGDGPTTGRWWAFLRPRSEGRRSRHRSPLRSRGD